MIYLLLNCWSYVIDKIPACKHAYNFVSSFLLKLAYNLHLLHSIVDSSVQHFLSFLALPKCEKTSPLHVRNQTFHDLNYNNGTGIFLLSHFHSDNAFQNPPYNHATPRQTEISILSTCTQVRLPLLQKIPPLNNGYTPFLILVTLLLGALPLGYTFLSSTYSAIVASPFLYISFYI